MNPGTFCLLFSSLSGLSISSVTHCHYGEQHLVPLLSPSDIHSSLCVCLNAAIPRNCPTTCFLFSIKLQGPGLLLSCTAWAYQHAQGPRFNHQNPKTIKTTGLKRYRKVIMVLSNDCVLFLSVDVLDFSSHYP